jgi:acid phosphatase
MIFLNTPRLFQPHLSSACKPVLFLTGLFFLLGSPSDTLANDENRTQVPNLPIHSCLWIKQNAPCVELPYRCRVAKTLSLDFRQSFRQVIDEVKAYLLSHPKLTGNVVLDLDETLMDNRAYFLEYGAYEPKQWAEWVSRADAPAIPETRRLVHWLQHRGYSVYFISGRRESQRGATVRNLHTMGIRHYEGLFLKPDDHEEDRSPVSFKAQVRQAIEKESGKPILVILGDQASDLKDINNTQKPFQLPNPIYHIP